MRYFIILFLFIITTLAVRSQVHIINVEDFKFTPSELTIDAGDTIRFEWENGIHPIESETGAWETFVINNSNQAEEIVLNDPGEYPYYCVHHQNLGMVGSITVEQATSLDVSNETLISIFPNPATENININVNYNDIDEISIYNMLGKSVYSISPYNNNINLDISGIPRGLYYIIIKSDTEVIGRRTIIKK